MTVDTSKREQRTSALPPPSSGLEIQGQLPRWAVPGGLAASAVVIGLLLAVVGFSIGLFVVGTVVLFAVALYVASRRVEGRRKATDRLVTVIVSSAFGLAVIPLISVIFTVVSQGLVRFDPEFFSSSMRGVVGEGGGAYHAVMGTLIITGLAAVMSIPVGLLTAIYLVEYGKGRLARAITFFVDVMTGIPSIVAGLFAVALFTYLVGPGARLGFAGAVALSVLMIPVVVRATEEMLKIVPNELREAAFALGVPKWRTILKVVIPTSIAGIASGITLAIARVIGETAPLLVAVGLTTALNFNPFDGRMATLPVFAYLSYATPGVPREPYLERAWTAALVLIIIVMLLNLLARLIARMFAPKTR
ncbi:phosphate ABC transporter permease PstA [Pseudonocardia sp. DSM 110487]|uniref:phosphate ABC transporter permease PstA n=1 Tax=Pseudonocardia sp. DSM 110487 TaxID=2865833 RepID=UPI001C697B10|nr:phosphate ABC transporter permease PstA [Pseudonocardia sp. DSM 110487]QYN36242.1 phosphate ABC transporter permease PstA [Pseudonocardia sp. DSM 110487]